MKDIATPASRDAAIVFADAKTGTPSSCDTLVVFADAKTGMVQASVLGHGGMEPVLLPNQEEDEKPMCYGAIRMVSCDHRPDGGECGDFVHKIRNTWPNLPIVICWG